MLEWITEHIFESPFWEEEIWWDSYIIDMETHFKLCMEWFSYSGFGCV